MPSTNGGRTDTTRAVGGDRADKERRESGEVAERVCGLHDHGPTPWKGGQNIPRAHAMAGRAGYGVRVCACGVGPRPLRASVTKKRAHAVGALTCTISCPNRQGVGN